MNELINIPETAVTNSDPLAGPLSTKDPSSTIPHPPSIDPPGNPCGPAWNLAIEPWPQRVDGNLLLDELARLFASFVVLPKYAPEALALWTLHTYAFHLRDTTAYLGIESPQKRCGKTTLLAVLSALVNRPVVSSNISPSAFFRVIEDTRPTLLIDEADTLLRGNDELRGILNSGYTRSTAFVVRVATPLPKNSETKAPPSARPYPAPAEMSPACASPFHPAALSPGLAVFSSWCPKAIASIGHLPETLGDRCVLIRMQRKTLQEHCERLRNLRRPAADLRRQCARFVLDYSQAIAEACPDIPADLNDRAADIWEPLLALAGFAGDPWPMPGLVSFSSRQ